MDAYSQIKTPQVPQVSNPSPIYGSGNNITASPSYQQPNQVTLGAKAQDIVRGQNNATVTNALKQKQQEIEYVLKEIKFNHKRFALMDSLRAVAPTAHLKRFDDALKHLQDMLQGKVQLSVSDAYFTIEAAFGNLYLSRAEYDLTIRNSVAFIKAWMLENGLDPKDNNMQHYALQKFMSEELTLHNAKKITDFGLKVEQSSHHPFHYDFNDYTCEKDYRNCFLTKCLATGFGQCASMPAVYLVLAEGLGAKAYLTFAPQHTFIKYKDNDGVIRNYEPTSNWEISDKWYKDNMFISARAYETGVYLDTFNTKQIVANCVFDLAIYYTIIDRTGKEDLILNCLKAGMAYFPKNNHLLPLFLKSQHLKTMLREEMRKANITSFEDLKKSTKAKYYYDEFMSTESYISNLGYQDMPSGMYEALLNEHEFKGKVQQGNNITGKEKRNLFNSIEQ